MTTSAVRQPSRTLIVANTYDGLRHGVVKLLESVGYEVLGMGPNWTYVPNYTHPVAPLVFDLADVSERPGYYLRKLTVVAGQERGNGTLYALDGVNGRRKLIAPDEPVEVSYNH